MDAIEIPKTVRVICIFSGCRVIRVHEYHGYVDNKHEIGYLYRCTSCGRGCLRHKPVLADADEPEKQ